MRLVAWNMRSATDRKWAALRAIEPDLAVLSEAARAPAALSQQVLGDAELSWEWEGTNEAKGVAIGAWGLPLRRRVGRETGGRWVVAGAVDQLLVIGIWSCPKRGGAANYAVEVERSLDAVAPLLDRYHDIVIAGDFNVIPRSAGFGRIRQRLEALGMVSAYHHFSGDPFGHESALTFHARHDGERGRHIDYMWCSESLVARISDVRIGEPGPSDHSPIIADFDT